MWSRPGEKEEEMGISGKKHWEIRDRKSDTDGGRQRKSNPCGNWVAFHLPSLNLPTASGRIYEWSLIWVADLGQKYNVSLVVIHKGRYHLQALTPLVFSLCLNTQNQSLVGQPLRILNWNILYMGDSFPFYLREEKSKGSWSHVQDLVNGSHFSDLNKFISWMLAVGDWPL